MTRPIKISDELYERLKEQARTEGLTLQDALVELITTPHEGLNKLREQFQESRKAASSQQQSLLSLEEEIRQLRKRVDHLFELREKHIKVFNDWAEVWERIAPLERDIDDIASRVSSLESVSHRHIGQAVKEQA